MIRKQENWKRYNRIALPSQQQGFSTVSAIILALLGIGLLYRGGEGATLSTMGVILVMLSSLSYTAYIVIVNQSSIRMSSLKLTFYVLLIT